MMYYPDFFWPANGRRFSSLIAAEDRFVRRNFPPREKSLSGDERCETSAARRLRFFQTWHKCQSYIGHSKTAIKRWVDRACFRPFVPVILLSCFFPYVCGNIAKTVNLTKNLSQFVCLDYISPEVKWPKITRSCKKGREMDNFNNQGITLRDRPARVWK